MDVKVNFVKDFNNFDKSCTADNLGRLYEMKGDREEAIKWRTANAPDRMICSYFDVCLVTHSVRSQFYKHVLSSTVSEINGLCVL